MLVGDKGKIKLRRGMEYCGKCGLQSVGVAKNPPGNPSEEGVRAGLQVGQGLSTAIEPLSL